MTIPDFQMMMLPLLRMFNEGQTQVSDCLPGLIAHFNLSKDEAAELLPSGQMTYLNNRANWARSYMGKAGLLASPKRGVHEITDLGRKFLATQPTVLNKKALYQFDAFMEWRQSYRKDVYEKESVSAGLELSLDQTPEDTIEAADKILKSALRDDLLAILYDLYPIRFERLILDLLTAMGYAKGDLANSHMIRASGDGGIDGIIFEDALELDAAVYIQAKRYAPENKVSRPAIQQFVGSLSGVGATKGVFVTTSDFSSEARASLGKVLQRVVLVNGQ